MRTKLTPGYLGGKSHIAPQIAQIIDHIPHRCYVEPFAGSLAVFLARKSKPKVEVVNDINRDVINFFLCIRDHPDLLIRKLRYTPYSPELFGVWKEQMKLGFLTPDVERAARWFALQEASFSGNFTPEGGGAWIRRSKERSPAETFAKKVDKLYLLAERLRGVIIECGDYEEVVRRYDDEDTMIYCCTPDTPIRMADETLKPICEVKIGDLTATGKVKRVYRRKYRGKVLKIRALGNPFELKVTPEHPILAASSRRRAFGFVKAGDLEEGDEVFASCGSSGFAPAPVISIEECRYEGDVYNLEIEGTHAYIASLILTHNCDPPYFVEREYYGGGFDHDRFARVVNELRSKVIISYYPCDLIDRYYKDWKVIEMKVAKSAVLADADSESEIPSGKPEAVELLLLNFEPLPLLRESERR